MEYQLSLMLAAAALLTLTVNNHDFICHSTNKENFTKTFGNQHGYNVIFSTDIVTSNSHALLLFTSKSSHIKRCTPIISSQDQDNKKLFTLLLLVLAGDIETNPGPPPKHPCSICHRAVKQNDNALLCDQCETFTHKRCLKMNSITYSILEDHESMSWICCQCGLPSFCSSFFNSSLEDLSTDNSFSSLDTSLEDNSHPIPIATSSPKKSADDRPPKKKPCVTILLGNMQSLNNKKKEIAVCIENNNPDIILATETWLKGPEENIKPSDIFPDHRDKYSPWIKNRQHDNHGGVMTAISNNYISSEYPDTNANCEIKWAKIETPKQPPTYIGTYYQPKYKSEDALTELASSLRKSPQIQQSYWAAISTNQTSTGHQTPSNHPKTVSTKTLLPSANNYWI